MSPRSRLARTIPIVLSGVVLCSGLVLPAAASAATSPPAASSAIAPDAAFFARIAVIEHDAAQVTLTGSGQPGEEIRVSGPTVTSTSTRVLTDGSFSVTASVDGFGVHELTVTPTAAGSPVVLRATTAEVPTGATLFGWEQWSRAATVSGYGAWKPGATISFELGGRAVGQTTVEPNGRWAYRIDGVGFGVRTVTVRQAFDGAVQSTTQVTRTIVGDAVVEQSDVDLRAGRLLVSGLAPSGTEIAFDDQGAPIETLDGRQSVPVVDGRWSAELPLPAADVRFHSVRVTTLEGGQPVGSAEARFTLPLPFSARVDVFKPKKLVLSGTGDLTATIRFTDEDGSPVRDKDGQDVTAEVRGGVWTRTLDPRLFDGGTVTATATDGDRFLGATTLTFR